VDGLRDLPRAPGPGGVQDAGLWSRLARVLPGILAVLVAAGCGGGPRNEVEYRAGLRRILEEGVDGGEYPGVSCVAGTSRRVLFRDNVGLLAVEPEREEMPTVPVYDLELATGGVFTSVLAFSLMNEGFVSVRDTLGRYLPEARGTGKEGLTLARLMSRSSGVTVDPKRLADMHGREEALAAILSAPPGEGPSPADPDRDAGMLLVGAALERLGNEGLDALLEANLLGLLGARDTGYRPPLSQFPRIAPGEVVAGEYRRGVTYYRGARPFDGICGAAGVFSSVVDLGELGRLLVTGLEGRQTVMRRELFFMMTTPITPYRDYGPPDAGRLRATACGWDVYQYRAGKAGMVQVMGVFSRTGCTFLIVPRYRFYLVFLTNLHHPGGSTGEKRRKVRARVHRVLDYALGHLEPGGTPRRGPASE
jgi:CubicO group peptidase (beta-lactamase class C family)